MISSRSSDMMNSSFRQGSRVIASSVRFTAMHKDPAVDAFYSTWKWRKCRAAFLASKGGLCEVCLSRGLIEPATEAHHKVHITSANVNDPAVTLNHDNLMALCDDCHAEQHRQQRWRCGPDGRVAL